MIILPRRRSRLFLSALLLAAFWPATGQDIQGMARREIARRREGVVHGEAALERGRIALEAKDFSKAHDEYRIAVTFLPDALTTADKHDAAVSGFCDSGVKLAERRIAEGKYGEAERSCAKS